jgi:hypothetical protein
MAVTQGGRDTAWQDVTHAIKECKRKGWQHSQLLIDALDEIIRVYQADLDSRYDNDPNFGVEDYSFLTNEITRVQSFLSGDMSLDELALCYSNNTW